MPKKLERKLAREATRKGITGARRDAYVYGTMARIKAHKKRGKGR